MMGKELLNPSARTNGLYGMTSDQKQFPWWFLLQVQPARAIWRLGKVSLPHMANIVDDICIIRSMHTSIINHDPALTFFQTCAAGNRASMAHGELRPWTENKNLPAFCVLLSRGKGNGRAFPLEIMDQRFPRLRAPRVFSSAAGRTRYFTCRTPKVEPARNAGSMLDTYLPLITRVTASLVTLHFCQIQQYEMAYRMQTAVPEIMDVSKRLMTS
jgi:hypothetical protein